MMQSQGVLSQLGLQERIKQFAVLIDPDKQSKKCLIDIVKKGHEAKIDFFFVPPYHL